MTRPVILAALLLAACGGGASSTATASEPLLALVSGDCRPEVGYAICEGAVKNLTAGPLKNVMVLVSFVDADGKVQRTDEAIIAFNPVLAGQESPWKTIGTHNPALTRFRIAFKEVVGGSIAHRDDRKK